MKKRICQVFLYCACTNRRCNQQYFWLNSSVPFSSRPKAKYLSLRCYEKINDTILLIITCAEAVSSIFTIDNTCIRNRDYVISRLPHGKKLDYVNPHFIFDRVFVQKARGLKIFLLYTSLKAKRQNVIISKKYRSVLI